MENLENYVGYLKYSGTDIEQGLLDLKKSAQALVGFDESLRFFLVKEMPALSEIPFEIPVRINKGSWEALIPQTIGDWIIRGLEIASVAYLTTAAKKIAENDFKNVDFRLIFKKALGAIQWTIRIGKHIGSISNKKLEKLQFRNNNMEIGVPDSEGKYLFIPKEYLDYYLSCPANLLEKIAGLVAEERRLIIGIIEDTVPKEVEITIKEKYVFAPREDDSSEVIFPELKHGQHIELIGEATKGNEITNAMGFQYKGHILTCHPRTGSIVRYKNVLFGKCKITGVIDRLDKFGNPKENKPRIIFTDIVSVDDSNNSPTLF